MKTSHQEPLTDKPLKREPSPLPGEEDGMLKLETDGVLKLEVEDISELEAGDASELETDATEDITMPEGAPGPIASIPRLRKMRFSDEELNVLVQEVHDNVRQLFGDLSMKTPSAVKNQIWEDILTKVNAVGVTTRTVHELKKRWHDLRRRTKMKLSVFERSAHQIMGGPLSFQPYPNQRLVQETIHPQQILGISDLDTSNTIFTSSAAISTVQDNEEDNDDSVEQEKPNIEVAESPRPQRSSNVCREHKDEDQQFSEQLKSSQDVQQKLIREIRLLRNEMTQSAQGLQQSIDMHLAHIASSIDMHMGQIASSIEKHLGQIAANMLVSSQSRVPNAEWSSVIREDATSGPYGITSVTGYTFNSCSSEKDICDVSNQTSTQIPKQTPPHFSLSKEAPQKVMKAPVKRRAECNESVNAHQNLTQAWQVVSEENGVLLKVNEDPIHQQPHTTRTLKSRPSCSLDETSAGKKKWQYNCF
ncbi:uncharacterized protein WCC33_013420 [Rhinophrynus dorsalis]